MSSEIGLCNSPLIGLGDCPDFLKDSEEVELSPVQMGMQDVALNSLLNFPPLSFLQEAPTDAIPFSRLSPSRVNSETESQTVPTEKHRDFFDVEEFGKSEERGEPPTKKLKTEEGPKDVPGNIEKSLDIAVLRQVFSFKGKTESFAPQAMVSFQSPLSSSKVTLQMASTLQKCKASKRDASKRIREPTKKLIENAQASEQGLFSKKMSRRVSAANYRDRQKLEKQAREDHIVKQAERIERLKITISNLRADKAALNRQLVDLKDRLGNNPDIFL